MADGVFEACRHRHQWCKVRVSRVWLADPDVMLSVIEYGLAPSFHYLSQYFQFFLTESFNQ